MMMSDGSFVLSLESAVFPQLQRQMSWRHSSSERVGAAGQPVPGPGEDTIELSGLIAPDLTGSRGSLTTLRRLGTAGESQPLVDGTGWVYGPYLLLAVNETATLFFPNGTPRRIEFQLSLRCAGDIALESPAS
ncbi:MULTISPECIES: phage tail protein [Xanthomonas]|uniref:Oxidoreductase n=1 Tax=Xanthomonas phaseoli pv. dieffenbachiae TaxID=92828 RepID=A0A1V9HBA5_9XANT|nr:phage tail protein [Xanthomonas phaseoli]MBO9769699.1 phage tail protein [Xanthomonas phaseoli pv. dieffenbachiae]MBO9777867.1 phage tail protein [Xanthomonas phaseoli pv. dieffenbachiae]MBO9782207.1 phage tail protein [Xanthomonas phaseoli pv. dieffenbachiae]MBO9790164.1 phage tail protein [Xanthomonas phaseoli pv. dieffenbachiae]MBO9798258.1 phage tail protein [Xanthomonas phaseoli pv. dieffenbachiae]